MNDAASWLDRFFASYHRHRPVNATFIGEHEHDHRLPDLSEAGAGDALAEIEALLETAPTVDPEPADTRAPSTPPEAGASPIHRGAEALDVRLATGFLSIEKWERTGHHVQWGNPSYYTGEAVFSVMGLFLNHGGTLAHRVEAARSRMDAMERFLRQARANVASAPTEWTRRAMDECQGALAFFGDGIDRLAAELGPAGAALRQEADVAGRAVANHLVWLETELLRRPRSSAAAGEEALDLVLGRAHFVSTPTDDILGNARTELDEARAWLEAHASDHGADSPEEALAELAGRHPEPGDYVDAHRRTWVAMRALVEENALLTWPDVPIRYVERPGWARAAAPHLYFLFYRSPAARNRPPVHDYLVAPLPEDPAEQVEFLRAHNDSVIKLNHVVHHGGVGHHVQNWHAFRGPSRVGRMAAVDCAARIAMTCGGTMAEGWACYATDLVDEFGGLTPLESYAERHGRVRMCCRAVVDIELHRGRMSLEDAAAFYVGNAGMSPGAARSEAVKNSMFPGGAVMYLLGRDRIHALRSTLQRRSGAAFDLRRFHDTFLSHGSVPVELVAQAMEATWS